MSFTSTLTTLATKEAEQLRELPMPAWAFGAIALGSFVVLLGVLWFFRNTAARHDRPSGAGQGDAHGSHGSHGSHGTQGTHGTHGTQGTHGEADHGAHR